MGHAFIDRQCQITCYLAQHSYLWHIPLVAITRTTILVPNLYFNSLQLIWRLGRRFHLRTQSSNKLYRVISPSLRWRHNVRHSVSNHQPYDCLLNRLFRRRSKKTSKLRVTGLCAGNSSVTGEFPHKWPVTRKMFPFDGVIMIMFNQWTLWVRHNNKQEKKNRHHYDGCRCTGPA